MIEYKYYNANPKNRKTGDCSTRALVSVLGLSYEECLKEQMEESLKCFYDPTSKQVIERVLARHGWVKVTQPRKSDGKKYTVGELDKIVEEDQPTTRFNRLFDVPIRKKLAKTGLLKEWREF